MLKKQWLIRDAVPGDLAFIYNSWLLSYRDDSILALDTSRTIFFDQYSLVVDNLLETSNVLVACKQDEENVIFGYLVYEGKVAHYAFVKEAFRELGIAQSLVAEAFGEGELSQLICTHRTQSSKPIFEDHKFLIYNPFLLYNKGYHED